MVDKLKRRGGWTVLCWMMMALLTVGMGLLGDRAGEQVSQAVDVTTDNDAAAIATPSVMPVATPPAAVRPARVYFPLGSPEGQALAQTVSIEGAGHTPVPIPQEVTDRKSDQDSVARLVARDVERQMKDDLVMATMPWRTGRPAKHTFSEAALFWVDGYRQAKFRKNRTAYYSQLDNSQSRPVPRLPDMR